MAISPNQKVVASEGSGEADSYKDLGPLGGGGAAVDAAGEDVIKNT
jgi:hypothetical protein